MSSAIDLGDLTTTVSSGKSWNPFDVLSGITGLIGTGYNIYTNKRDFDYQKALQQQMFQREDTAVQRRMADLQAAGLNPNIAAGSAAGAGSVVSRSSTNDVNMGAFLDSIQAANQIKMQKQQVDNAKTEGYILDYKMRQERDNYSMLDQDKYWYDMWSDWAKGAFEDKPNNQLSPYVRMLNLELQNAENNASILSKSDKWFTINQVLNAVTDTAGAASGLINSGASLKRAKNMFQRTR